MHFWSKCSNHFLFTYCIRLRNSCWKPNSMNGVKWIVELEDASWVSLAEKAKSPILLPDISVSVTPLESIAMVVFFFFSFDNMVTGVWQGTLKVIWSLTSSGNWLYSVGSQISKFSSYKFMIGTIFSSTSIFSAYPARAYIRL